MRWSGHSYLAIPHDFRLDIKNVPARFRSIDVSSRRHLGGDAKSVHIGTEAKGVLVFPVSLRSAIDERVAAEKICAHIIFAQDHCLLNDKVSRAIYVRSAIDLFHVIYLLFYSKPAERTGKVRCVGLSHSWE